MYSGILLIAGMIDLKCRKIPQYMPLIICIFGVLFNNVSVYERIAGAIIPAFPLFLIALNNPKLKGGDIKYFAAMGLSVGINSLTTILFFDVIISVIYSFVTKKNSVPLAFVGFVGYVCWTLFV